jgi:hypothetical protein
VKTDGNYFVSNWRGGEHSFKFGARWRDTPSNARSHVGGFVTARLTNGVPNSADLHRDAFSRTALTTISAYLHDSMTFGRATINAGVRVDQHRDRALAATIGENPIVPEFLPRLEFPGADAGVTFRDVSPRFGITWNVSGDGRTVAKFAANRFYGQFVDTSTIINPVGATLVRFPWADQNGDLTVQRHELDLARLLAFSANYNPSAPANVQSANLVDAGIENDRVTEFIVGLDHELMPNFGLGIAYLNRDIGNFAFNTLAGVRPEQFQRVEFSAPCVNTSCAQPTFNSAYYVLPGAVPNSRVRTNQEFSRRFHGLEVTARKRLSGSWMLNGSVTLNSATYNAPPEGYADTLNPDLFNVAAIPMDPTNREFIEGEQTLINGTRWVAKLSGLYQLPWDVNVAGTLNARQGFPLIPNIVSPNRPGLGQVRLMVEPYATQRYDNLVLVDVKAEKRFTLRRASVIGSVDVFNLMNTNTVLNRVTTQNSAAANRVVEVTGPRVVRFGLRFTF